MWVGDAVRLQKYWTDHPTLHEMVAGYLGIKPPKKLTSDELGSALNVKVLPAPIKRKE